MSWFKKIASIIARNPQHMVKEVLDAMPTAQCLTAEPGPIPASEPIADAKDDNPFRQRRYFVKRGLYVDNDEERGVAQVVESAEEIADEPPIDLKTLFPKLSLR